MQKYFIQRFLILSITGVFLTSQGRLAEAAEEQLRAAELSRSDYELSVAAASALRQADRREEAEIWYRHAAGLRPHEARSHTNLGAILHLNGKYRQAAAAYREALRLQPGDATTITNLHKLAALLAWRARHCLRHGSSARRYFNDDDNLYADKMIMKTRKTDNVSAEIYYDTSDPTKLVDEATMMMINRTRSSRYSFIQRSSYPIRRRCFRCATIASASTSSVYNRLVSPAMVYVKNKASFIFL